MLLGSDDSEAVPVLIELLKDEEITLRHSAGHALGRRKSKAKAAVPYLLETYKKRPEDSLMAGWALHMIDPETATKEKVVKPSTPTLWA